VEHLERGSTASRTFRLAASDREPGDIGRSAEVVGADTLGHLITEFAPVQTKVMPFISNLLPEGHMRTYLAERAGVNPEREFFLLWVLGKDLPGAITVEPADGEA
jgi:serine/threonine-protein kinase HipA